jgi:CDGSH-type Zn-finger protein
MPKPKLTRLYEPDDQAVGKKSKIVVSKNGPYLVSGCLPLRKEISVVGKEGEPDKWVKGKKYSARANYALCRCGRSGDKPFCDGAHARVRFDGTEAASRKSYVRLSEKVEGPAIDLSDAESLCASARFCLPKGGTWRLTLRSKDPEKRRLAIRQAGNCPSGRLVVYDKTTGKSIEPEFAPSISLIEDPQVGSSGPIWVKGGVPIESGSGRAYETRNRVTLCRCGRSKNKPFCDGNHIRAKFNDGDESLNK